MNKQGLLDFWLFKNVCHIQCHHFKLHFSQFFFIIDHLTKFFVIGPKMVTKHSQLRYSNVQKGQNSQNRVCLLAGVKIAQNWFPGGLNKFDILIFVTRLALWNYLTPRIVAALRLLQLVQREDFRGYSVKYSKFWVISRKFDFLFVISTLIFDFFLEIVIF